METHFACPERATDDELAEQIKEVTENPILDGLMNITIGMVAVMNEQRQIVALNASSLEMLGVGDAEEVLGLRHGEVLHCVHAHEMPGGCGTSEYCSECGAAIALVASLGQDKPVSRTCAMKTEMNGKSRDLYFKVSACPVSFHGHRLVLLFLNDVTDHQRWAALERTFFHDINNIVMGLLGFSELLTKNAGGEWHDEQRTVYELSLRLAKEIAIQNCLARDGISSYQPKMQEVWISKVLKDTEDLFLEHAAARNKTLTFSSSSEDVSLRTDITLLERVLNNMIVNALEATEEGGEVRLTVDQSSVKVSFRVWNKQVIRETIAKRIFQRNFSTKSQEGRGLGTYSMKLFGEQYLGGTVDFTTSEPDGTVFQLILNR